MTIIPSDDSLIQQSPGFEPLPKIPDDLLDMRDDKCEFQPQTIHSASHNYQNRNTTTKSPNSSLNTIPAEVAMPHYQCRITKFGSHQYNSSLQDYPVPAWIQSASYDLLDQPGRSTTSHSFKDIRSATQDIKRWRERQKKYYSFRYIKEGQAGATFYNCVSLSKAPLTCKWSAMWTSNLDVLFEIWTKKARYKAAQGWPRPPQWHYSRSKRECRWTLPFEKSAKGNRGRLRDIDEISSNIDRFEGAGWRSRLVQTCLSQGHGSDCEELELYGSGESICEVCLAVCLDFPYRDQIPTEVEDYLNPPPPVYSAAVLIDRATEEMERKQVRGKKVVEIERWRKRQHENEDHDGWSIIDGWVDQPLSDSVGEFEVECGSDFEVVSLFELIDDEDLL